MCSFRFLHNFLSVKIGLEARPCTHLREGGICIRSGCQVPINTRWSLVGLFAWWLFGAWVVDGPLCLSIIYAVLYILRSCPFPLRKSSEHNWLLVFLWSVPQCLYVPVWFVDTKIRCGLVEQHEDPRSTLNRSSSLFRSSWPVWHFASSTSFVFQRSHSCMGIAPQAINIGLSWIDDMVACRHSLTFDFHLTPGTTGSHLERQSDASQLSHAESLFSYLWLLKQTLPSLSKPFAFINLNTIFIYIYIFIIFTYIFISLSFVEFGVGGRALSSAIILPFFATPDVLLYWKRHDLLRGKVEQTPCFFHFVFCFRPHLTDCRHIATSWLLCRTCALQTHTPKWLLRWLLRLSSHEADLQWCCLHHFELESQRYPASMFRLQTSKFGSIKLGGNMRAQHSLDLEMKWTWREGKLECNICTPCLLLWTMSIQSIHVYTPDWAVLRLQVPFQQILLNPQPDPLPPTYLKDWVRKHRSCYSEPSGPIFLQRKRLTCSTFTMSSPTARRWRFHLDNP